RPLPLEREPPQCRHVEQPAEQPRRRDKPALDGDGQADHEVAGRLVVKGALAVLFVGVVFRLRTHSLAQGKASKRKQENTDEREPSRILTDQKTISSVIVRENPSDPCHPCSIAFDLP